MPPFGSIDAGNANFVLNAACIQHCHGVTVRHANDDALEFLGRHWARQ